MDVSLTRKWLTEYVMNDNAAYYTSTVGKPLLAVQIAIENAENFIFKWDNIEENAFVLFLYKSWPLDEMHFLWLGLNRTG